MSTAHESYAIRGIPTKDPAGRSYIRQDIDTWYKEQIRGNRLQLTLFVQALAILQERPLDDQLSYFRLAGIHSAPWVSWDGAGAPDGPSENNEDPGYCVHNDYIFPTWHRVYILLFEQVLYETMLNFIADSVPKDDQEKFEQEAAQWRLPYWDFARFANEVSTIPTSQPEQSKIDQTSELRLPILAMRPTVEIYVYNPDGSGPTLQSRANPLYKYTAPKPMGKLPHPYTIQAEDVTKDGKVGFAYPWDKCISTTKYGILDGYDQSIWADGGQNWLHSNLALNERPSWEKLEDRPAPTLQEMTYRLLTSSCRGWADFSSTRYDYRNQQERKEFLSLEFIHNNIHNWVGGSLFARPREDDMILQGVGHMSSVNMAAFDPIFWLHHCNIDRLTAIWQVKNPTLWFNDDESRDCEDRPLLPFHKDTQNTVYTSRNVRDWRALGYDYEITQGMGREKDKESRSIDQEIESLYGVMTKCVLQNQKGGYTGDYSITVLYDRYALGGASYKINLFIGESADTRFPGTHSRSFVGSVYNFSASLQQRSSRRCSNCERQKEARIESVAQVPATLPVRRYLADNPGTTNVPLYYMVVDVVGQPVDVPVIAQLVRSNEYFFENLESRRGQEEFEVVCTGEPASYIGYGAHHTRSRIRDGGSQGFLARL